MFNDITPMMENHTGGCQNYGPFLGPCYHAGNLKGDHNFDNHLNGKDNGKRIGNLGRYLRLRAGQILGRSGGLSKYRF